MCRDSDEELVDWQTNMPKFDCRDRNPRRNSAGPCSFEARAVECTFVTGSLKGLERSIALMRLHFWFRARVLLRSLLLLHVAVASHAESPGNVPPRPIIAECL
jgi:hypothetical protein